MFVDAHPPPQRDYRAIHFGVSGPKPTSDNRGLRTAEISKVQNIDCVLHTGSVSGIRCDFANAFFVMMLDTPACVSCIVDSCSYTQSSP
jgi:hypothetical protein